MTIPLLPTEYARRIADQLGDAAQAYFDALAQPPVRGLRCNLLKMPDAPLATLAEGLQAPVPWAAGSYYLSLESGAGLHPLHEAGAYYLQEPSAMLPATLLAPKPGETVLDLCAAPGGKSTQLAAAMAGMGTLVCNEPVPSRAQILSRNLERMGVVNAAVVCAAPEALAARWPGMFDAILVDAPCSGEGMFRRHPEARLEWDAQTPAHCAARQRHILESALAMLKVGGRLCYATCTFSREENEGMIQALLAAHPELAPVPFTVPLGGGRTLPAPQGYVRLYPHTVAGEGHFTALLTKTQAAKGESRPVQLLAPAQALLPPQAVVSAAYEAFRQACNGAGTTAAGDTAASAAVVANAQGSTSAGLAFDTAAITQAAMAAPSAKALVALQAAVHAPAALPMSNAMLGDTLLYAPPLPPLQGVRVLRAGLALGQAKGKVFAPDHALAMAAPPYAMPRVAVSCDAARIYQRGEVLPAPDSLRGYVAVTCHGLPLGFAKASEGWLKNHYPKGLRRP